MPNIDYPIPDLEATVERQVAIGVAKQLCTIMELPESPVVVFNGQHEERASAGSQDQDNINRNELNNYSNVFITYEEEEHESAVALGYGYMRPNETYLFLDKEIGVKVFVNHVQTTGRVQFKYQGIDRNRAHQFNTRMRTKYFKMLQTYLLELEYNYFIPNEVVYGLLLAFEMKKAAIGSTEENHKYLARNFIRSIYVKKRSDGAVDKLYKREVQTNIYGTLDPDTKVLLEKEGENSKVTLTYTFEFSYYKPNNVRLYLPIMIGQNSLPKQLRKINQVYDPEVRKDKFVSTLSGLLARNIPQLNQNKEYLKHRMIRSPNWDEFDDPKVKNYMLPIMCKLCQIGKVDKRTIVTLEELNNSFNINEYVFKYMQDCGKEMLTNNQSAVLLTVFYNDNRMSCDIFEWDEEREAIVAKEDLDILTIYHVVVSLSYSLNNSTFDKDKFIQHGQAAKEIINRLYPNGTGHDINIGEGGVADPNDIDRVLTKNGNGFAYLNRYIISDISLSTKSRNKGIQK